MRRNRTVLAALAALALATACALLLSGGSSAAQSKSQQLFRTTLLADAQTTGAVKQLLRDRGGIVAPEILFGDLTGDGRSDAVVLADAGGAAGVVALYVFSTDGKAADSPLRAVYRSQQLYRASVSISGTSLIVRTPEYASGDDLCCPAKIAQRTYAWSEAAKTFTSRGSVELPGPTTAPATTPATPATPATPPVD
ncbi:MAG TPA: hypothetical protein VHZ31_00610 [Solirubrobacteraceae bacterium]|nr:hypothetical protein [Solirubrobacteraceae bacterium]